MSVNVAEASVTVGGETVGRASREQPLNLDRGLPVGEVEVIVGAPGYREQRRRVVIESNAWAQAHFSLEAEAPARQAFEPELVRIEGGCFQMGSPESEEGRDKDERQHRVCVEDFALGKHEVTQAQWQSVMGSNPSHFAGCGDCPVEEVSRNDVQDYLEKLNARTGKSYRLPTEAEWEYACRGRGKAQRYCGGDEPGRLAWYSGNSDSKTHPVGGKRANGLGLHDMSGNVWEWTCSRYDEKYGGAETKCAGKNDFGSRVLRGGAWYGNPRWVRAAARGRHGPGYRTDFIGFRLAQD